MDSKISNGNLDGKGHESPSTVEEDLSNTSPSITDHRQASPDSHRQVQKQHFEPIWRQAVLLHDDPRMEGQRRTVYWIKFLTTKHYLVILLLGQILAWCIVSTNTLTTYLATGGLSIPAFQTFFNYVLLNLVYSTYTIYRYGFKKYFKLLYTDGWKFFLLAFADVEGNYFVVKGFAYTNLLSAQLLNSFSIVVVVILSFIFLKVRYHWTQIAGIVICVGGLALLVVSDNITGKGYDAVDAVKGDLFILLGAFFYGISNVLEEFFVSKRPLYEVVGQLGFWAMIINGVQVAIFERESLQTAVWFPAAGGYLVGYTLSLFVLYTFAPILFRLSSALFYNLSLLTANFWGLIIGISLFNYYVYFLYPIAFVMIIIGLLIYYLIVRSVSGEAKKPWLGGEAQSGGVVGVGTYKRNEADSDIEALNTNITTEGDSTPMH